MQHVRYKVLGTKYTLQNTCTLDIAQNIPPDAFKT